MSVGMNNGLSQALHNLNAVQLRQLADEVGDASKKPSALLQEVASKAGLSTSQALQSPQFRAGVEQACLRVGVPRYGDQAAVTDPSKGGLAAGAALGHKFLLNRGPNVETAAKRPSIQDVIKDESLPLSDRLALGLMELDRLVGQPIDALRKDLSLVKGSSGKVDLAALQTKGPVGAQRLDLLEDAGKSLLKGDVKALRAEFGDVLSDMNKAQLRTFGAKCVSAAQDARRQLFDPGPMDPLFR